MLPYVVTGIVVLAAVYLLDQAIGVALRWCAPILPNSLAGHDGWLVDTRRGKGIFDRQTP